MQVSGTDKARQLLSHIHTNMCMYWAVIKYSDGRGALRFVTTFLPKCRVRSGGIFLHFMLVDMAFEV